MNPYLGKALFIGLFLILVYPSVSLATDAIDPGVLLYKARHLEQAKQYYEAEIAAAPKNAQAHYMLANILLDLNQSDEAKKQYQICITLDRYGSAGKYSRLALIRIDGNSSVATSIFQSDRQQKIKDSVGKMSSEISEEENKQQAECDAKVKEIYAETDAKVTQLENEMQNLIASNGHILRTIRGIYYDPEPANEMIRQEYYPRIDQIKERARYDANNVIETYKTKAMALEDCALSLEKSYINDKHSETVIVKPEETNIYIRSYQTADTPSGKPVPVMAAPPKLLPGIKPGDKPTHQGYMLWISTANKMENMYF